MDKLKAILPVLAFMLVEASLLAAIPFAAMVSPFLPVFVFTAFVLVFAASFHVLD